MMPRRKCTVQAKELRLAEKTAIIAETLDKYSGSRKGKKGRKNKPDYADETISKKANDLIEKHIETYRSEPDELDVIIMRQLEIDEEKYKFEEELKNNKDMDNQMTEEEIKMKRNEFEERYAIERRKIEEIEERSLTDDTVGWAASKDIVYVERSLKDFKDEILSKSKESDDDEEIPPSVDFSITDDDVYTNTYVSSKILTPFQEVFDYAKLGDSLAFFNYISQELEPCQPAPKGEACEQMLNKGICLCCAFPWPDLYSGYNDDFHIQKSANPLHFAAAKDQTLFFENLMKYKVNLSKDIWPHFESMIGNWLLHKDYCKMTPHFVAAYHGYTETLRQIIRCITFFLPSYLDGEKFSTLGVMNEVQSSVPETLMDFAIMKEEKPKKMIDLVLELNLFDISHIPGAFLEAVSQDQVPVRDIYKYVEDYMKREVESGRLKTLPAIIEEMVKTPQTSVKVYNGKFRKIGTAKINISNALHLAAEREDFTSMNFLVNKIHNDPTLNKSSLFPLDEYLMDAMTTAICTGNTQIISLLKMSNPDIPFVNFAQNLKAAIMSRHEKTLDLLLAHYVNVEFKERPYNYLDVMDHTKICLPLKIAIAIEEWGIYDKILKLYVEHGYQPNSNIDMDLRESFTQLKFRNLKPSIHAIIKESLRSAGGDASNRPAEPTFLPVSHRINRIRPRPTADHLPLCLDQ